MLASEDEINETPPVFEFESDRNFIELTLDSDTAPFSEEMDIEPPLTSTDSRDSILMDSASVTTRPLADTIETSPSPIITRPEGPLEDTDTEPPEILTADDPDDMATSPDDRRKDPDEAPDEELIDTPEPPSTCIEDALVTATDPPVAPAPPDSSKEPPTDDADRDILPLPDAPEPDSIEIDPPALFKPAPAFKDKEPPMGPDPPESVVSPPELTITFPPALEFTLTLPAASTVTAPVLEDILMPSTDCTPILSALVTALED